MYKHCCTPNLAEVEVSIQRTAAKKRARKDDADISKIYREEMGTMFDQGYEFVAEVPLFGSMKSTLYRHRRQHKD